ncbi:Pimeloyl-ACP methyl ester carboxylesterase [Ornithinibacillus halophilus]|uniref:Pimeloyl-ACP methyl ester carboxylesterase n=2 Tax=Ornithinibacillus halophilus TaxID=930117 RepID=A0A1M5HQD7_9BACI|nr:Pimeloyl-ACP methyl ester carboxylesterase [Ornithinibacillus halophilus]
MQNYELLTINHRKIEVLRKGNSGPPIIILAGMGCSFDEWYEVTDTISTYSKVILFHRPGLGKSEIGNEPRTTTAVVEELKKMLDQIVLNESVILIGHSYGGLCVQHFAKVYPEKVSGVILVDSTSVDLKKLDELYLPVLDEEGSDAHWLEKCLEYSKMTSNELKREIQPSLTKQQRRLPFYIQNRLLEFQVNPSMYQAMYSEITNWKDDAELIKNLGEFPDLPLIVIKRDKEYNILLSVQEGYPEDELRLLEETWGKLIHAQANLSERSELILANNATHAIYLERPDIINLALQKLLNQRQ